MEREGAGECETSFDNCNNHNCSARHWFLMRRLWHKDSRGQRRAPLMALSYKSKSFQVLLQHFHLIWIRQRAHKPTKVSAAPTPAIPRQEKRIRRNWSALVLRSRTGHSGSSNETLSHDWNWYGLKRCCCAYNHHCTTHKLRCEWCLPQFCVFRCTMFALSRITWIPPPIAGLEYPVGEAVPEININYNSTDFDCICFQQYINGIGIFVSFLYIYIGV